MSKLISQLAQTTGLSETDIKKISSNAPRRYAVYPIDKRNGEKRWIAQPARELKAIQRSILELYLSDLPVHPAATAYEKGTSIKKNALSHIPSGAILKLDFQNFFPSIRSRDWELYAKTHDIFDDVADLEMATKFLFFAPKRSIALRLAIGAPSSPHLSNLLLYDFDKTVSEISAKDSVKYTRYADDMTFSANRTGYLNGIEKQVRIVLRDSSSPKLYLNDDKKVVATKKYKREVTGLILTNDDKLSLGHERKKLIRSKVHYFINEKLTNTEIKNLQGILAFALNIEPEFVGRLVLKYGQQTIDQIMSFGIHGKH